MKTLIISAILLFNFGSANAQKISEKEVPEAVKNALIKQHPNAKTVEWEKENGNFEAEIKENKQEMSVVFDVSGKLIETEKEIQVSELPGVIQDYIKNTLGGKRAKEASLITLASGTTRYEAEVDDTDYIFDETGKLIRKETDKEKDVDK